MSFCTLSPSREPNAAAHPSLRLTLLVLSWIFALTCAVQRYHHGVHAFDYYSSDPSDRKRADGNSGHAEIDFAGQWLMARMFVLGYGHSLYDRNHQWPIVRQAFPRSDESEWVRKHAFPWYSTAPMYHRETSPHHDADWLMYWFMGKDSAHWQDAGRAVATALAAGSPLQSIATLAGATATLRPEHVSELNRKSVGGPLYPPVQALLYSPLGLFEQPRDAYRTLQLLFVASAFLTGLGICRLSKQWISWPLASSMVLLFTGFRAGIELGQNPALTLLLLVWGWVHAIEGKPIRAGMIWGVLAFKPVWAAMFLLMPLLTRQWRFTATMVVSAACYSLLTLPFVGLQTWFDWLAVGREASQLYLVNRNWIFLSRDLFGLPRRFLLDFDLPDKLRDRPAASVIGWTTWVMVIGSTIVLFLRAYGSRRDTGPAIAFLALGAYLSCYRFMYYDALIALFPIALLLADRSFWISQNWFGFSLIGLLVVWENVLVRWDFELMGTSINTGVRWPWDTVILLVLWLWLGLRLWLEQRLRCDERSPL